MISHLYSLFIIFAGTNDFFGLNHYTTQIIADQVNSATPASFDRDQNVESTTDPSWVG